MIYLDNSSTTKADEDTAALAHSLMVEQYFNPASLHYGGSLALDKLSLARFQVAQLMCCPTDKVYFCSSGTQANSAVFMGIFDNPAEWSGKNIVTTQGEHTSVLQGAYSLERFGCTVRTVGLPDHGKPGVEDICNAVDENTVLVSVMAVNNETGEIFPVKQVVEAVKRKNSRTLVHSDIVQAYGKIPLSVTDLGLDFATCSAHKIHSPKGAAALYASRKPAPTIFGGSQERGLFPGTENVPAWCAFGYASSKCLSEMEKNYRHVSDLKNLLRDMLLEDSRIVINSSNDALPYILNFSIDGNSSKLIGRLSASDIFVSSGAACRRGETSHVLLAAQLPESRAAGAVRVSFSKYNTKEEIEIFAEKLKSLI